MWSGEGCGESRRRCWSHQGSCSNFQKGLDQLMEAKFAQVLNTRILLRFLLRKAKTDHWREIHGEASPHGCHVHTFTAIPRFWLLEAGCSAGHSGMVLSSPAQCWGTWGGEQGQACHLELESSTGVAWDSVLRGVEESSSALAGHGSWGAG